MHGMGLLLQEKAGKDHSGICIENHTAERAPVFLIKINQTVQRVENLFAHCVSALGLQKERTLRYDLLKHWQLLR